MANSIDACRIEMEGRVAPSKPSQTEPGGWIAVRRETRRSERPSRPLKLTSANVRRWIAVQPRTRWTERHAPSLVLSWAKLRAWMASRTATP
ncbi:MAG: hypothetical protein ABJL67_13335 [Sulfitobacter sp.]